MSERRLFLDRSVGEIRGVVTLEGRPERLILRRESDDPRLALGARLVARVASVEPALGSAFLDLGGGVEAILAFKPDSRPVRGSALEVEIRSEPRAGKLATVRPIGPAEGAPRLLAPADDVADILRAIGKSDRIVEGRAARDAADEAEDDVLRVEHPLPGGGSLAIEPTRALTAVDVDLGERKGADAKKVTRQANLAALQEAARLLRLKGLGGIVVLDLAGKGHDGTALLAAARLAFAPDNPGVAMGPVGRFGTMELLIPRRTQPLAERLCHPDGSLTEMTLALRLMRRIEAEGEANRGARITAECAPRVAQAAAAFSDALAARIGARFTITADAASPPERLKVSAG